MYFMQEYGRERLWEWIVIARAVWKMGHFNIFAVIFFNILHIWLGSKIPVDRGCHVCTRRRGEDSVKPFVNCSQFMYLVISLLGLRAGFEIWLYQFLIIAYLFTFYVLACCGFNKCVGYNTCVNLKSYSVHKLLETFTHNNHLPRI